MSKTEKKEKEADSELEWMKLREQLNENYGDPTTEPFMDRLGKKLRQHPLVPIGVVSTVVALLLGFKSFYTGDRWMSQYMMRARVGAQAITVAALISSMMNDPRFKLFDFSHSPALSSKFAPDTESNSEVQSSAPSITLSEAKPRESKIVAVAKEAVPLVAASE